MSARKINKLLPYSDYNGFIKQLCFKHLNIDIIKQVIDFKLSVTDSNGFLLLKNNPIGDIPKTPIVREELDKSDFVSENSLVVVANLLGDCISYVQESNGHIVNNFFPIQKLGNSATSDSSDSELELHTENAFHQYSPDYLILLCLRQDIEKQAITYVSSINHIKKHLTKEQIEYFFQNKYNFLSDYSENNKNCKINLDKNMPVLYGSKDSMLFRFDHDFMYSDDDIAMEKLNDLKSIAWKCAVPIYLEAGDILIIDNKRTSHARSKFIAKYDGNDRWIQRVFVTKDRERIMSEIGTDHRILKLG